MRPGRCWEVNSEMRGCGVSTIFILQVKGVYVNEEQVPKYLQKSQS